MTRQFVTSGSNLSGVTVLAVLVLKLQVEELLVILCQAYELLPDTHLSGLGRPAESLHQQALDETGDHLPVQARVQDGRSVHGSKHCITLC